jgi:hypothetical protein
MKRIITITAIFIVLFYCSAVTAQEKPLIVKGLFIGMDVNDARNITEQLLGKEWKVTPVGDSMKVLEGYRFGEDKIFGTKDNLTNFREAIFGDRGFAIISAKYHTYEGFISSNQNNHVTRISLSGQITNFLFLASTINAEDFATSFWKNYNMPEFNWIPFGWTYTSPNGYTIIIKTDKFIDIKKEEIAKSIDTKPAPSIKFE